MATELALRAEAILREQRDVYRYWRSRAPAGSIPAVSDIDPLTIPPRLLPGLSLIDVSAEADALFYRLAGTAVREIYGAEMTGEAVFDCRFINKPDYWHSAYRRVVRDGVPMQGILRGAAPRRSHLLLFWLRLPLSNTSGGIGRIMGYDAAVPSTLAFAAEGADPDDARPFVFRVAGGGGGWHE